MAQDISLLGAVYSDVPSVLLPKQGGGTAQFDDTTDADATASDILTGKTAYVNGVKITGTGTGGGGSVTQDQDGFIVLPLTGGGGGGSGLEYESGTFTPTSDAQTYTITFSNAHDSAPMFAMVEDSDLSTVPTTSYYGCDFMSWYEMWGNPYGNIYGICRRTYNNNGNTSAGNASIYSTTGLADFVTSTTYSPSGAYTDYYFRANRTYKWIAVWKPTT